MPRLHLPSDEFTMPLRCPNHPFRPASAGEIVWSSYGFTGNIASSLFNSALWQILKNHKPVIVDTSQVDRMIPRAPLADREDNARF